MTWTLLLSLLLAGPATAWAHAGHHDDEQLEATLEHYSKIVELTPDVLAHQSLSTPKVRIQGQDIPLNGPFWQLVQGWTRLYYRDLQHACDGCITWTEEQFVQVAQDHAARGFVSLKINEPLGEAIEHLAVGTVGIGSQLGKTAAVAKLSAEVAETVLSKMVGGGGVHVVCSILDAIILFGTRHLQTVSRAYSWSPAFQTSGVTSLIKLGYVSSVVRKTQKRVRFVLSPSELSRRQVAAIDAQGPNRWWGWVEEGKRSRWLHKLAAAEKPLALSRREFLGQRMKRYLWLKGRKRGHSDFMKGHLPADQAVNQGVLWILAVQEGLIERSFLPKAQEALPVAEASLASTHAAREDEIRRGLSEEFGKSPEQVEFFEQLLKDVEVIFNPEVPKKVRYFHAASLEAVMAGFLYGRFHQVLSAAGEDYGREAGLWKQLRLHWRAGRFGSYIYEWADFLRLAALQSDRQALNSRKYEAMEALLRLFRHFAKTADMAKYRTVEDLMRTEEALTADRQNLVTFTPWREKSVARSWLPWRSPLPKCEEMNRL